MILLIGAGIMFIVFGVGMLIMPNTMRKLDRLDSQTLGQGSRQGDVTVVGRVLRSLGLIVAGVAMLSLPFLIF